MNRIKIEQWRKKTELCPLMRSHKFTFLLSFSFSYQWLFLFNILSLNIINVSVIEVPKNQRNANTYDIKASKRDL